MDFVNIYGIKRLYEPSVNKDSYKTNYRIKQSLFL